MGIVSEHPTSARSAGFTFLEVVIAMVIVAILGSALARFVDFDAANKAAAELGYQGVETRWKAIQVEKISDTVSSKSTAFPSLADLSGYVEATTAEPAPDTAPMLVDWRWASNASWGGNSDIWDVRNWVGKQYDSSGEDFKCSNPQRYINPVYLGEQVAYDSGYKQKRQLLDFRLSRHGETDDSPLSENAPTCLMDMEYKIFTEDSVYPLFPIPWSGRGWLLHTRQTGYASQRAIRYNTPGTPQSDVQSVRLWYQSGTIGPLDKSFADEFRLDCSSYSSRYGVAYQIKGISGFPSSATAGLNKESGAWLKTPTTSDTRVLVGTSPNVYTPIPNLQTHFPTRNYGHCERVGPAPAVPAATDGKPGDPPPKSDFSGLCVAKGWSVSTFKPDGTPTSSASDAVARISSPTEDASCE